NSWGSPRNAGFKYNWARAGATSATLLSQGQHTGLASQASSEGVWTGVLAIGSNDFSPRSGPYSNIYNGDWSAAQIQSYVNQSLANIETALATVRNAGTSLVVASLFDTGPPPFTVSRFPNAANRDRVTAVVQMVNAGLKELAQKYQVP